MADTPNIRERDPASAQTAKTATEFKVAEKRDDGTVILQASDGRMFPATLKEGVEAPHKGSMVTIGAHELDGDGIPKTAEITKLG